MSHTPSKSGPIEPHGPSIEAIVLLPTVLEHLLYLALSLSTKNRKDEPADRREGGGRVRDQVSPPPFPRRSTARVACQELIEIAVDHNLVLQGVAFPYATNALLYVVSFEF